MKWMDKSHDWRETGFEYRPGDDLEQTTPIIRPSRVDSIPGLKDYLARNPELLRDFFWPDGMVRVSGREYNGLIESPCFKGGKFACVSCHSLHESEPNAQLAAKALGNDACLQCHEKFRDEKALTTHTHHVAKSSGSECYNCHMPYTTYGILKSIRSHQISSPSVDSDLKTGRPNACNLCHIDRTLRWTSTHLANWTAQNLTASAQSPGPLAAATTNEIPHVARQALAGDAGQRVIAAWHLSWPPALQASRTNLVPILLAQLLDDPYAAVRCVAERSFRANGFALPPGYDYTIDPRVRAPVRDEIWKQYETTSAPFFSSGGHLDREKIETVLVQRNDRPVRLRE
jgi:predicted CXXCH cytochrome family protein